MLKKYWIPLFFSIFFISCFPFQQKESQDAASAGMKEIKKGSAWYNRGCYYRSLNSFIKANELFSGEDAAAGVAMSLNNMGNSYRAVGNFNKAEAFLKEAYQTYSDIKDYKGMLQVLSNTASLLIENGKKPEALKIIKSADKISEDNSIIFTPLLNIKAAVMIKEKQYNKAEQMLNIALQQAEESASEYAAANFLLAEIMIKKKEYNSALQSLDTALAIDKANGFYKGMAEDLEKIAKVKSAIGKKKEAVFFLKRSVKIYALIGKEKKCLKLISLIESLAKETGTDTTITKHLIDKWLKKEMIENSCE